MPWPDVDAVVIGASAGGVEALLGLLPALPAGLAAAVVVVLHRPADSPGLLAPLLQARCQLPVDDALDKQALQPGRIVLAPANYHLLVEPGPTLALSIDAPELYSRPAINPLFESAAAVFGKRLLALLLTGANADGSQGVAAVRHAGGEVWIQDPSDAHVATMPAAALEHAGADRVLTLAAMRALFLTTFRPQEVRHAHHPR